MVNVRRLLDAELQWDGRWRQTGGALQLGTIHERGVEEKATRVEMFSELAQIKSTRLCKGFRWPQQKEPSTSTQGR